MMNAYEGFVPRQRQRLCRRYPYKQGSHKSGTVGYSYGVYIVFGDIRLCHCLLYYNIDVLKMMP